jgi:hypothetical protein
MRIYIVYSVFVMVLTTLVISLFDFKIELWHIALTPLAILLLIVTVATIDKIVYLSYKRMMMTIRRQSQAKPSVEDLTKQLIGSNSSTHRV